jgi:hypothetical protein
MPDLISPFDMVPADAPETEHHGDPPDPMPDDHDPATDLAAVRELVLRAHPDVVPELVAGETIAGLIASVEPARAAYARLAESLSFAQEATPASPVPAGGSAPIAVDPDRLPAAEKIRRGLAAYTTKKG